MSAGRRKTKPVPRGETERAKRRREAETAAGAANTTVAGGSLCVCADGVVASGNASINFTGGYLDRARPKARVSLQMTTMTLLTLLTVLNEQEIARVAGRRRTTQILKSLSRRRIWTRGPLGRGLLTWSVACRAYDAGTRTLWSNRTSCKQEAVKERGMV